MEAVCEAKRLGGSYIYVCPSNFVFWTSPFYSGERFAGALISGSVNGSMKDSGKVKALANMMQICADQISKEKTHCINNLLYNKKNRYIMYDLKSDSVKKPADEKTNSQLKNNALTKICEKDENNINLIDMERLLFANLRRGDTVEGKKVLMHLLEAHYQRGNFNFPAFQMKAVELAVLLSRAVSNPDDLNDNAVLETNTRCMNKIKDSTNYQEVTEILTSFSEKMSGRIFSFHGVRHFPVLRKAERFIWENYTRKLSLEEIADISGLSAPYFSTIFREEMGENLSNYLNRLRIEKAALMLITTNTAINKIAVTCGFNDQSWFSKIFKTTFGITPGKYRDHGNGTDLRISDFSHNGFSSQEAI
jgi:YesN/AraC family two-component response regulator